MKMVVEIDGYGSEGTSPPGRVPKQRLSVPRISPSVAAALRNFTWLLGQFSRVSESGASYRRRKQGRWRAPLGAARVGPAPTYGVAILDSSSVSSSIFRI